MNYWLISKVKPSIGDDVPKNKMLSVDKWIELVETDKELVWFKDTPHGKEVLAQPDVPERAKYARAYLEYSIKKGYGPVILSTGTRKMLITLSRMTCKRLGKLLEIAEKLDAKLWNSRTEVKGKKLEKLRAKYCK